MAGIGTGIRTYLLTVTAVTDIVSSRIRPDALIQNETFPAIVIDETNSDHEHTISGGGGIVTSQMTVACYSETRLAAENLGEKVRAALQGYEGSAGSETIQSSQLSGRASGYLVPADGSDGGLYVTSLSFEIVLTESIPSF